MHPVLLQPPATYLYHIRIYSSQKQNTSQNDVRRQVIPFSAIPWS